MKTFFHKIGKIIWSRNSVGKKNLETREVWLKNVLDKIPAGQTILDAGAGELKYNKFCNHLKYTSQDFGKYDGQGNQIGLQTEEWDNTKLDIVSDITKIPIANASFDNIMCIEVLEHLPEPIKAIKEFSRILKPNGKLIITAPFCSLTHFAPYYYSNGFSKYWYEKILKENNFEISEIKFNGNYFEYLAQEIRRIPDMKGKNTTQNKSMGFFYKTVIYFVLRLLSKLSKKNKASEEVLCFGLHVLAIKK